MGCRALRACVFLHRGGHKETQRDPRTQACWPDSGHPPRHFCGWKPPSPTAADGRVTEYKPLLSQHLPWFLPPPHSLEHLLRGARQQDKKEIQAQKSCPFLLGRP